MRISFFLQRIDSSSSPINRQSVDGCCSWFYGFDALGILFWFRWILECDSHKTSASHVWPSAVPRGIFPIWIRIIRLTRAKFGLITKRGVVSHEIGIARKTRRRRGKRNIPQHTKHAAHLPGKPKLKLPFSLFAARSIPLNQPSNKVPFLNFSN